MSVATMTSKGQITIPKEIREQLRLKTGDRVRFTVFADGTVKLRAQNRSLLDLVGTLKPKRRRHVTVEEMNEAIRKGYVKSGLGL